MKKFGVICVAAALAPFAHAATMYSNILQPITGQDAIANYCSTCLDINGNYDSGYVWDQFSDIGGAANGNLLNTLILSLFAGDNTDSGSFSVNLYADNSTTPGIMLDTLGTITDSQLNDCDTGSALTPAQDLCLGTPSLITLTLTGMSITLASNTAYWIGLVADPVNSTSALWNYEADGSGFHTGSDYYANEDGFGTDDPPGTVYSAPDSTGPYEMRVTVTANSTAPEPASFLLLGTGTLILGLLGRKRKK